AGRAGHEARRRAGVRAGCRQRTQADDQRDADAKRHLERIPQAELQAAAAVVDRARRLTEVHVRARQDRDVPVIAAEVRGVEDVEALERDRRLLLRRQLEDLLDPQINALV